MKNGDYGLDVTFCDPFTYRCKDSLAIPGEYYEFNDGLYLTTPTKMVYINNVFNKNLPPGLYVNQFRDHHVEEGHKSFGSTWHNRSCNKSDIGRFFYINESKIPKLCLDYDEITDSPIITQELETGTYLMKLGKQNVFNFEENSYVIVSVSSHKYTLVNSGKYNCYILK